MEDQIDEASTEVIEDALDTGDFDDIYSLKGILLEALGDTLFKVALIVVITFNFLYTFYNAFKEKRHDISKTNCICEPNDKRFYNTVTFGTTLLWVSFLLGYCGIKILRRCCKSDDKMTNNLFAIANQDLKRHKRFFKRELVKLAVSTYYLDDRNLKHKKEILQHQSPEEHYPMYIQGIYPTSSINENRLKGKVKCENYANRKCSCGMFCKLLLIAARFMIQMTLVPLLIFQWLDQYAWSCIMDGDKKKCEKLSEKHYHTKVDQSLMIYGIYVAILLAVLLTIMIKWFPKGFPSFWDSFRTCIQPGYTQLIDSNDEQTISMDQPIATDLQASFENVNEHENNETVL